jgi:hypothetical protein
MSALNEVSESLISKSILFGAVISLWLEFAGDNLSLWLKSDPRPWSGFVFFRLCDIMIRSAYVGWNKQQVVTGAGVLQYNCPPNFFN